jgi:hypothetical protein
MILFLWDYIAMYEALASQGDTAVFRRVLLE